ncbi:MAG: TonB-dependent receptor [Bacteroidota bacterium]
MIKTFQFFGCCFLLVALGLLSPVVAQTGSVAGTVTAAATGESLPGANVLLIGTGTGAATDLDGRYRIDGVSEGRARLVASFVGYTADTLSVAIVSGETVTLDFVLQPGGLLGEGVEVTAQLEGQLGAIREQRESNTIVNVVSADRIREYPDANAAESVGRLPGVSLQRDGGEGTRVQVRGLDPNLTSVTINGERIPGSGGSGFDDGATGGRSVDLSLISADLLEGIELFKALTPDKDADAIGGTVNLVVREAPSGTRGRIRTLGTYNDLEGAIEGYRLDGNASTRLLGDRLGLIATANLQRAPRGYVGNQAEYDDSFAAADDNTEPRSFEVDRREEIRDRAGASLTADWRLPSGGIQARALYSRSERDESRLRLRYRLDETDAERAVRTQLRTSDLVSTGLSGEHRLGRLTGDWALSLSQSLGRQPDGWDVRFRQDDAFSGLASSNFGGLSLAQIADSAGTDLRSTYVRSLRRNRERTSDRDVTAGFNLGYPVRLGGAEVEFRAGAKVRDKGRESDYTRNEVIARDLEVFAIREGLDLLENGSPIAGPYFGPDESDTADGLRLLETPDRDAISALDASIAEFYIEHPFFDQRDYTADETVSAAYGMTEITAGELLVVAGVRYEHTETGFVGVTGDFPNDLQRLVNTLENNPDRYTSRDTTGSQSYGHFFPQLVTRYRISPVFDVRAAVTRTLARPDYLDLVAYENVNDIDDEIERGNVDLRPTLAWNVDGGISAYTPVGLFALGGFYKQLQDFQYDLFQSEVVPGEGTFTVFQTVNGDDATVYGIEAEAQVNASLLPGILSGLLLTANYAYTISRADFPLEFDTGLDLTTGLSVPELTTRESSLPGQATHIANATLGYERRGFSARLSFQYQGAFLSEVARVAFDGEFIRFTAPTPERPDFLPLVYDDPATEAIEGGPITQALVSTDVRTRPFTFLDLQVSQELGAGLRLIANASNLTNQFERQRREGFARNVFSRGYGWSAEVGIQLSFR